MRKGRAVVRGSEGQGRGHALLDVQRPNISCLSGNTSACDDQYQPSHHQCRWQSSNATRRPHCCTHSVSRSSPAATLLAALSAMTATTSSAPTWWIALHASCDKYSPVLRSPVVSSANRK